jgi:hypothetical protein
MGGVPLAGARRDQARRRKECFSREVAQRPVGRREIAAYEPGGRMRLPDSRAL